MTATKVAFALEKVDLLDKDTWIVPGAHDVFDTIVTAPDSDLPPLRRSDEILVEVLELVAQYQQFTRQSREKFINGYLNLSRANFHLRLSTFGPLSLDMRTRDACIVVEHDPDFRVCNLLDNLMRDVKQQERNKKDCVDETESQLGMAKSTGKSPASGTLKSRQKLNAQSLPTESIITEVSLAETLIRDPIKQFGGIVPHQLRQAQTCFVHAIEASVMQLNIARKIARLVQEIDETDGKSTSKSNSFDAGPDLGHES